MTLSDWTVVRVRGNRGPPAIDGAEFLSCAAAVRGEMGNARWHHRWVPDAADTARDGLRIDLPWASPEAQRVVRALEDRVPPPDGVIAEPLRVEADLDAVQTEEEMESCLTLLWRYSDFLADLRVRNPHLGAAAIRDLTPGALLTLVTGDRRHLERALDEQLVSAVPAVSFGHAMSEIRAAGLKYRLPPENHADACSAARIHHLAGCTFASPFYPIGRSG